MATDTVPGFEDFDAMASIGQLVGTSQSGDARSKMLHALLTTSGPDRNGDSLTGLERRIRSSQYLTALLLNRRNKLLRGYQGVATACILLARDDGLTFYGKQKRRS